MNHSVSDVVSETVWSLPSGIRVLALHLLVGIYYNYRGPSLCVLGSSFRNPATQVPSLPTVLISSLPFHPVDLVGTVRARLPGGHRKRGTSGCRPGWRGAETSVIEPGSNCVVNLADRGEGSSTRVWV